MDDATPATRSIERASTNLGPMVRRRLMPGELGPSRTSMRRSLGGSVAIERGK